MNAQRFFILLSLLIVTACNKPEKPVFEQREFIDLSGTWKCDLGNIQLPGTIDESRLAQRTADTLSTSQLTRLYPYVGKMSYTVSIPPKPYLSYSQKKRTL
jgi:hypothetical protein